MTPSRAEAPLVLGVETSCDETSVALLDGNGRVLGHVVHSQDTHRVYGGVVPELAAREHLRRIDRVAASAFEEAGCAREDVDAVAVTEGPGLIGPLLVGVSWASAFALALERPLIPVHHMEAHLFGPVLENPEAVPPFVALLVSGGHTLLLFAESWGRYTLLGTTRDDAVGEAFDKVAGALGLPYPGGAPLERLAEEGDPGRFELPRPLLGGAGGGEGEAAFDFSFSGLKTAVVRLLEELDREEGREDERAHVAAAFQEAVLDVLTTKVMRAVQWSGCQRVLLGGGVAANRALRARIADALPPAGELFTASPRFSLDNGAMIARAGLEILRREGAAPRQARADPALAFPGVVSEPAGAGGGGERGGPDAPAGGTHRRDARAPVPPPR